MKISFVILCCFFFTIGSSFATTKKKPSGHSDKQEDCCEVELDTDELMKDKSFLEDVRSGQSLFRQHCQKCHGESGEGDGRLVKGFKNINLKPANLRKLGTIKKDEVLKAHIQKGKNKMPGWSEVLSEQETENIITFIRMMALGKIKK